MLLRDRCHRNDAIMNAVQTLQIGLRKNIAELRARIAEAPNPGDDILEHFQYLFTWDSKTDCAARIMGLAQESFQAVLIGIRSLTECYAILDEPEAAKKTLDNYLGMVDSCNICEWTTHRGAFCDSAS